METPLHGSSGSSLGLKPASLAGRLLAQLVDGGLLGMASLILLSGIVLPLTGWAEFEKGSGPFLQMLFGGTFIFFVLVYFTWGNASSGQSLGKRLLRIQVRDWRSGEGPTVGQALVRAFGLLVGFFPLGWGYWWALWNPEGRTFHDWMAGTWVVKKDP